jgi:hypothetical protein
MFPGGENCPIEANPPYQNLPSHAKSAAKLVQRNGSFVHRIESQFMRPLPSLPIKPNLKVPTRSHIKNLLLAYRRDALLRPSSSCFVNAPFLLRAATSPCLCPRATPATPPASARPRQWMNKYLSEFPLLRQTKILSAPVRRRQKAKAR